jgi:hypothetical protein
MKPIFFAIIMGLGLTTGPQMVRAQAEEKPTPKPPYLAEVPDYAHWTVTFKYGTSNGPASAAGGTGADAAKPPVAQNGFPTMIETIKTGNLRGVVLTFADGSTKQFTCQGDWVLSSTSKGAQLSMASPSRLPYVYYTTGFVLLDGMTIDMSTFKEAAEHNGVMAFHYKSGDVDVWIDPNSMLPLGAKQNGVVEVFYQFLTPPPRPFDIPKDQADLMKKEQKADEAVRSLR